MLPMIPRSQEPERGFVLAVLAQGADPDEELAEIEELARTAGVEPVGRVVQHRAAPGAANLRRQGQARGARSSASPTPTPRACSSTTSSIPVQQRFLEDALGGARDRPDAADPRHLRPARRQRRGEAPGRARAARVQPAAHAGHVAAPRAPRRRRRHARPRRVAARDRPPARPPPRLGAQAAPRRPRAAARDAPQGAPPHAGADRSRSPATRTSASRRS